MFCPSGVTGTDDAERLGEAMQTRATLASLLSGIDATLSGDVETPISGIAYDSRQVRSGDLFVAVPGFVHDGARFIADAVGAGAVAVVAEVGPRALALPSPPAAWAQVADARRLLAPVAARFWGNPSDSLTVVGVTGTNGKTTVTALLEAMLATRGPVGRWSTTAVKVAGRSRPAGRTTPEGPDLQRALRHMVDADCWAAAIEVSSHALTLHRVDGTTFAGAVFTNLSNDHLDFHDDFEDYLDAKAMLFERLGADGVAVVNVDDPASAKLAQRTRARVVGYGWRGGRPHPEVSGRASTVDGELAAGDSPASPSAPPAIEAPMYWIDEWGVHDAGSLMRLQTPQGELVLETPLFGPANAENLAAAAALALELGLTGDELADPVARFQGARGRFQRLLHGQPFAVLVDYAHTPDALRAALAAARDLAGAHRVIVVFGCGGDRDRSKRPMMGKIAAVAADQVVVTSDNPRSEEPEAIIDEIIAGIPADSGTEIERQADRKEAIALALKRARPGDCVLIAGKGHETEQVFADRTVEFDDAAIAGACLQERYPAVKRRAEDAAGGGS